MTTGITQTRRDTAAGAASQRPLCPLERWYWVFDQISSLNVIARCHVQGELSDEALQHALRAIQIRHPLLRCRIIADAKGENPRFVPHDQQTIDLQRIVMPFAMPSGASHDWADYVRQQEMNRRFDGAHEPLARLRILESGQGVDVILVISHAIADAISAMTILKEILQFAADPQRQPEPLPLMASFSDRFPPRHNGVLAVLKTLYLHLKIEIVNLLLKPRALQRETDVPFEQRSNSFIHQQLSKTQTQALAEQCRSKGVTVHSALCTALMLAIARDLAATSTAAKAADKPLTLGVGSPVNMRKDLAPAATDDEVGIFVGTFMTLATAVNQRDFWDIAEKFGQDIRRQSRQQEPFIILNFVRKTMPKSAQKAASFLRLIDNKGPGNACISNIGRYDFPDRIGALEITEAQFIAETSVTGTWVSTANTSNGQLAWNFSYSEGIITAQRAQRLADSTIGILLSQLQGQG